MSQQLNHDNKENLIDICEIFASIIMFYVYLQLMRDMGISVKSFLEKKFAPNI